jgi:hypothetical protein
MDVLRHQSKLKELEDLVFQLKDVSNTDTNCLDSVIHCLKVHYQKDLAKRKLKEIEGCSALPGSELYLAINELKEYANDNKIRHLCPQNRDFPFENRLFDMIDRKDNVSIPTIILPIEIYVSVYTRRLAPFYCGGSFLKLEDSIKNLHECISSYQHDRGVISTDNFKKLCDYYDVNFAFARALKVIGFTTLDTTITRLDIKNGLSTAVDSLYKHFDQIKEANQCRDLKKDTILGYRTYNNNYGISGLMNTLKAQLKKYYDIDLVSTRIYEKNACDRDTYHFTFDRLALPMSKDKNEMMTMIKVLISTLIEE